MVITIRKGLGRARLPLVLLAGIVLLHVALLPSVLPDHHDCDSHGHSSNNHAFCHCSCCLHGETSTVDAPERAETGGDAVAIPLNQSRGRQVISQLFRPPQSA